MRALKNVMTGMITGVVSVLLFSTIVAAAAVETKTKEGIGNYLTDEKGMTLYLFKKDAPGKSVCAGPCVDKWPLFAADSVTVSKGVKKTDLGTIVREDGKKQITYKGMPLYYYY